MHKQNSGAGRNSRSIQASVMTRNFPAGFAAIVPVIGLLFLTILTPSLNAANPNASPLAAPDPAGGAVALAKELGVHFIAGSSSTVLLEQGGKAYLVDLAARTIRLANSPLPASSPAALHAAASRASPADASAGSRIFAAKCAGCHGAEGKGGGAMKTPNFTNPAVQAALPDAAVVKVVGEGKPGTAMPAWGGTLSEAEINSVAAFVKSLGETKKPAGAGPGVGPQQLAKAYEPADDYLFSLPTGRRLDRHGLYLNFTHRFVYTPAFTGTGGGDTLAGLDDFSISSFGLRFGVTDKLSVSAYRSPSLILRPIELGVAYHFWDEHQGHPLNITARVSVDGQGDFSKNFTTNLETIVSRTVTRHAQLYFVPTLNFLNRELITKPGTLASAPPNLPGFNTFSLGAGGALDIRPTVALIAEVMPTLVNGPELGIHRPAYAFGIQKRVLRHAFTLGFSNSPGTVVSQRAGTRATFLGEPSADTPGGLFIGFDLMRQLY